MKRILLYFTIPFLVSCGSDKKQNEQGVITPQIEKKEIKNNESPSIIGERIDGPANIRNKPNGDILFELQDNALIETTELREGWYEVLIYGDIEYNEYGIDSIQKGRNIISNGETIGKVLKTHSIGTGRGNDFASAMLHGYTHKNNIKPETIIENAFLKKLSEGKREINLWYDFIKDFKLEENAVSYDKLETYYNYESSAVDPSPGFRIVLLFQKNNLVGFMHSRDLKIEKTKVHKLNWSYYVTFYEDYTEKDQLKFVDYMNEWMIGVD